jgi:signal peptidase II
LPKSRADWYNETMIDSTDNADEAAARPAALDEPGYAAAQETILPRPGLFERALPILIMAVVLLLDQASKNLVETRIPLYGYWAPFQALEGFFRITHTANTGAVFGLFQGSGMFFAALAVVVAGAIVYFNMTLPGGQWLLRLALGLQLGGALGNMVDRLRQGHVTDFIDVGPFYIFNVADMAIVGGVILFGIVILRDGWEEKKSAKPSTLHAADPPE